MWAETWEVIALADDGALVDMTFTRGNTGLWAGAGKARASVSAKGEGAVLFGLDAMPDNVEELNRGLAIGPDRLSEDGGVWMIQFAEGSALDGFRDLRVSVSDGQGRTDPVEMGDWTVEAVETLGHIQGFSRVGQRDRLIDGNAVILHRVGEKPPVLRGATRMAAFVLDDTLSIGIDQVGSQVLAWAVIDGVSLPTDDAVLRIGPNNEVQLDFRPTLDLAVQIDPRRPRVRSEPFEHLSGPELMLVDSWVGTPTRRVSRGSAIGVFEGRPLSSSAVLLWSDSDDPLALAEDPG
jgi:hypothetical protein